MMRDIEGTEDNPTNAPSPNQSDEAIDTLAHVLRTLGEDGFDTAKVRSEEAEIEFEAWARHVLVGAAPPGSSGEAAPDRARDWKGLRRFSTERRRDESEYVRKSSADLRATLWTFIQGMARAVPADKASDQTVFGQLEKLRSCLDSNDTQELRRIANASVDLIDTEIRERIQRNDRRIEDLADQVKQVSDELLDARQKLERDALTGLFNRGAFDEYIAKTTHLGMLSGQAATLMMIDVDDFKWVNDRYGHPAGDEVLKEISLCLMGGFSRRGDFVARYGGDEFAVILQTPNESVDRESGLGLIHRVRDLSVPSGSDEIRVTLSIGASRLRCGESSDEWLERSDRALYRAKENGRDCFVCESDMEEAGT